MTIPLCRCVGVHGVNGYFINASSLFGPSVNIILKLGSANWNQYGHCGDIWLHFHAKFISAQINVTDNYAVYIFVVMSTSLWNVFKHIYFKSNGFLVSYLADFSFTAQPWSATNRCDFGKLKVASMTTYKFMRSLLAYRSFNLNFSLLCALELFRS